MLCYVLIINFTAPVKFSKYPISFFLFLRGLFHLGAFLSNFTINFTYKFLNSIANQTIRTKIFKNHSTLSHLSISKSSASHEQILKFQFSMLFDHYIIISSLISTIYKFLNSVANRTNSFENSQNTRSNPFPSLF